MARTKDANFEHIEKLRFKNIPIEDKVSKISAGSGEEGTFFINLSPIYQQVGPLMSFNPKLTNLNHRLIPL